SWFRSPIATLLGADPTSYITGAPKVRSPWQNITANTWLFGPVTARSSLPSPSRSAIASAVGSWPASYDVNDAWSRGRAERSGAAPLVVISITPSTPANPVHDGFDFRGLPERDFIFSSRVSPRER